MAETRTRLRRLLAEKLDDCRESDVEQRLEELASVTDATFDDDPVRPVFAALGNRTRYRLARTLAVTDDELCVCELEPVVDVSESAVSHALSDLVDAGLATRRKAGNWRYYDATPLAKSLFETAEREVSERE
ncbi:ArsR/SmtB family transcription factor [Natrarchaeobius oligotrophus]|uniref:ArsR family transcriptional regulator n=1 Tax=Natrarchaeobius chitinivorans TaxID=1679083 RepID=A0A3N6MNA1_NATCH|nr:metalloregulator ArsR/SmtB family transcription factor [Natrarchaeobius chitinivorans]RQG98960.1 ArsR family transcriptional regulator [Natrarchaeobius chitinivorans]